MHSIIRHVIRLQCQQRSVTEEGGREEGEAEGQQKVEHRASAWTAVGKKCLERGCVYIKDYVIVEGEGAAAAGKGAATGKALRGVGKMEKRKNNSCSCSWSCCCSCSRGYRARLCKRCDNGHVNVVNGKSIGKAL